MRDFDRYSQELFEIARDFSVEKVLRCYQLPNSKDLHNMICGYGQILREDTVGFESSSIDYFEYEKELWKLETPK